MNNKDLRIGEKNVTASLPYVPNKKCIPQLIGREEELKMLSAAWMSGEFFEPLAPLLIGDPGVGKNRLVYELAERTGKALYIFQGHEDVTAEDLACAVRFSDDPEKKMDYMLSPLVTAMIKGGICFIDEIAKIRPRALALLVSVLDERRYIDSILLGERIFAQPGFRFIAATNSADLMRNAMPDFIRSRLRPTIKIGYPSQEEINQIISIQFPDIESYLSELLHQFWSLWQNMPDNKAPTPRDAIYIFNHAISLSSFETANQNHYFADSDKSAPFPLHSKKFLPALKPEHLKDVFEIFYDQAGTGEAA